MNSSSFNETHLTTTPLLHISNHKPLSGSKLTSPLTTLSLNTLQSNHLNSISPSLSLSPSSTSLSSCLSPLSSSSLNSSSFLTSPTKHASNLTPNSAFSPSTPSTPSVFSKIIPLTPANKYPTFKDSSPFNTFIEAFISKLTHLSSPTQIATLFLEAAETIDTEFQYVPSLFPLGIPTFSSFQYNWQSNPFVKKHAFLHSSIQKLLTKHAFIGVSALMVDLIYFQKKVHGSESTHCSLGHQLLLNALVSNFSYPLLSCACRPGHAHLFSWLESIFPAYWTHAPTGLSICWLFQQFLLNPPLTKNTFSLGHPTPDLWYNDLHRIYVEYIGQHFLTPNAVPPFLHVALVLLIQLIHLESQHPSFRLQPILLHLLLQFKRSDASNKRIAMLLSDVAVQRRILIKKLFASTQSIQDMDYWSSFVPVLWLNEAFPDSFKPVREEVAAIIHGFLFLPHRIDWWSIIYAHACSHPKITKEILLSLGHESIERLLSLQKELRLLSSYLLRQRHRPEVNEAYVAACHLIGAHGEPIPSTTAPLSTFLLVCVLLLLSFVLFVQPSLNMGLFHGTFWRAHQLLWHPSFVHVDFQWVSVIVNWILDFMDRAVFFGDHP